MDIGEVDRSDEASLRAFWEVGRAADAASRPHDWWTPWPAARVRLARGRPGHDDVLLAARDGGRTLAAGLVSMPRHDNLHLASLELHVHPAHQRRGLGSALLRAAEEAVVGAGRRVVIGEAYSPPALDGPGLLFAGAHGYEPVMEDAIKVVDLVETEPSWAALEAAVAPRRGGYRLVSWHRDVPAEHVAGVVRLNEAFNDEAPTGEMALEAEVWDEQRIRALEADARDIGRHVLAVAAVSADDEMVGLTEIVVSEHAPHRGFQSGTLVMPAHRGHALGLSMKLANHRALRARFPQCRVLMTGNAGVNAAMNAVNSRLGYRDAERCVEVQRTL